MKKLNVVFNSDNNINAFTKLATHKALVSELWYTAIPQELKECTQASQLKDGTLYVVAHFASAASKIKFLEASLLNALENSQKMHANLIPTKVTAIKVKVQVKSATVTKQKHLPTLNATNAEHLLSLSKRIEGTPLAVILNSLVSKAKK
jgi:hypothetical protein